MSSVRYNADNETYAYLNKVSPQGDLIWEYEIGWSFSGSPHPFIGSNGNVYVTWGKLHAVKPDGTVDWTWEDPEGHLLAGGLVDNNGNVYVHQNEAGYCERSCA